MHLLKRERKTWNYYSEIHILNSVEWTTPKNYRKLLESYYVSNKKFWVWMSNIIQRKVSFMNDSMLILERNILHSGCPTVSYSPFCCIPAFINICLYYATKTGIWSLRWVAWPDQEIEIKKGEKGGKDMGETIKSKGNDSKVSAAVVSAWIKL